MRLHVIVAEEKQWEWIHHRRVEDRELRYLLFFVVHHKAGKLNKNKVNLKFFPLELAF